MPPHGGAPPMHDPTNAWLAERLDEVAELLAAQRANPFRVRAYRGGASTLRALEQPAAELLRAGGRPALEGLDGIGPSLARALERLVHDGRWGLLERLRGEVAAGDALTTVPGIGPELAERIHDELGVETLYDLEAAAHDGRLARVRGMGPRRLRAVRESLAGRFRRAPRAVETMAPAADRPPVEELLDVDREYRDAAAADRLPRIAPRRFNPEHEAWLPVLHTTRGPRHYTALFSNTALAHRVGATDDWVILYLEDDGAAGAEDQWTVVTARRGPLAGHRVVRGREEECRATLTPDAPPATAQ